MIEGCTRRRHRLRRPGIVGLLIALAACAVDEPPQPPEVGEAARPSYEVRLDSESSDTDLFELVEDDDGIRVNTGPAGIAYRDDDVVQSGDFFVEGTFVQYDATVGYREAFGIFVGGIDLRSAEQEYTYLLVRTTGDFLIKRRIGEITETLVDWTAHEAVRRVLQEGDEPQNTLGVDVVDGEVVFLVNGTPVHSLTTARARPFGIAGVRVNHRLDVRVDGWAVSAGLREVT